MNNIEVKTEEVIPVKPEILRKETFLKMVENSVGCKLFNSLIMKKDGKAVDILDDGDVSCATFTSSILFLNRFLPEQKSTVPGLEKVLSESDRFTEISMADFSPEKGDIVFWESIMGDDGAAHRHVGFVLNETEAVSTTGILHAAIRHPLYKKPGTDIDRKIERVFRVKEDNQS
jgi:hypothetical protein